MGIGDYLNVFMKFILLIILVLLGSDMTPSLIISATAIPTIARLWTIDGLWNMNFLQLITAVVFITLLTWVYFILLHVRHENERNHVENPDIPANEPQQIFQQAATMDEPLSIQESSQTEDDAIEARMAINSQTEDSLGREDLQLREQLARERKVEDLQERQKNKKKREKDDMAQRKLLENSWKKQDKEQRTRLQKKREDDDIEEREQMAIQREPLQNEKQKLAREIERKKRELVMLERLHIQMLQEEVLMANPQELKISDNTPNAVSEEQSLPSDVQDHGQGDEGETVEEEDLEEDPKIRDDSD